MWGTFVWWELEVLYVCVCVCVSQVCELEFPFNFAATMHNVNISSVYPLTQHRSPLHKTQH